MSFVSIVDDDSPNGSREIVRSKWSKCITRRSKPLTPALCRMAMLLGIPSGQFAHGVENHSFTEYIAFIGACVLLCSGEAAPPWFSTFLLFLGKLSVDKAVKSNLV